MSDEQSVDLTPGVVWTEAQLAFLRDVLTRIADHPIRRIEELLPWNLSLNRSCPIPPAA